MDAGGAYCAATDLSIGKHANSRARLVSVVFGTTENIYLQQNRADYRDGLLTSRYQFTKENQMTIKATSYIVGVCNKFRIVQKLPKLVLLDKVGRHA